MKTRQQEIEEAIARGREVMAANSLYGTNAVQDAEDSATRASVSAHESSARADASNDPDDHADAVKAHLRAKARHAAVSKLHGSDGGNAGKKSAADTKVAEHLALAKKHAKEMADCIK